MLVAGLLTSDQLAAIFLNVDELIQVNAKFSDLLRDSVYAAFDSGDEDLTSVHVGKLFIDSLSMLRAFESYCTRQVHTYRKSLSAAPYIQLLQHVRVFFEDS